MNLHVEEKAKEGKGNAQGCRTSPVSNPKCDEIGFIPTIPIISAKGLDLLSSFLLGPSHRPWCSLLKPTFLEKAAQRSKTPLSNQLKQSLLEMVNVRQRELGCPEYIRLLLSMVNTLRISTAGRPWEASVTRG